MLPPHLPLQLLFGKIPGLAFVFHRNSMKSQGRVRRCQGARWLFQHRLVPGPMGETWNA